MQMQRTPHGFDWSCAKIECLASDEKKELQERLARIEALEKEMGA